MLCDAALQDVLEELDPSLEPVLAKAVMKVGNTLKIRLGDKELDYSEDFKLYITTKLGNPHYTPEVSTKATIINFAVKRQGLEAQLLGYVVQKEQPTLESQKASDTRSLLWFFVCLTRPPAQGVDGVVCSRLSMAKCEMCR
jgi:dynein heavy chain